MSPPRVLFVGLDAMDASLVGQLVDAGHLPVLGALAERSLRAPTRNPEGLVVGGCWPTIWSGSWPGRHGFTCFRQLVSGRFEIRRFTPLDIDVFPFWTALAADGRAVAVLDVPLVPPTAPPGGMHIVDLGTHDRMLDPGAAPAGLLPELLGRHGPHPIHGKCDDYARTGDWEGLLDALEAASRWRADVCTDLLARRDWDLFTTVYSESHCVGHQGWWLHDPAWPGHDAELARRLGDPLVRIYQAIDASLGRVLDRAGPATRVAVLMSHGMGAHFDGDHLFPEIADRLERASASTPTSVRAREVVLRRGRRVVRAVQARRHPGDRRFHRVSAVDGSRQFFPVPNNELYAALRLNLVGREPRGRVRPGREADELIAWISGELARLINPDTGRRIVRRILRVDDFCEGPRRDWLPDLLVDWDRSAPITAAASPTIGVVRGRYHGIRTGDHRPGGRLLLAGPGVPTGELGRAVDAVDIAPTLCAWLGVELPGVDGAPIPEATSGPT